jgi:hypothetical protein
MNKKSKYIIIPFLTITFGFFAINTITPDKNYSFSENRNLEKKPSIKDIKNNTFTQKFEKYYNDQFAFREEMNKVYKKSEISLNKTKVGNYYLGNNNWILGQFSRLLKENEIGSYSNALNKLSEFSNSLGKEVYYVSTPHKTNMLKHLYPNYVANKENIDINKNKFKASLNKESINYIDLDEYFLSEFNDKEREKIYFKTDHHWNGTGAFEGFKAMINTMNLDLNKDKLNSYFDEYKIKTPKDKNFVGSYNQNLDMIIKEEEYPSYVYREGESYEYFNNNGKRDKKIKEKDVIASQRDEKEWDYGGAYMRGASCNMLKIKNKKSLTDKNILLFRDSYEAPMTLMFSDIFREVQIVDPRNIDNIEMTYEEIIKSSDSDIVMFMYNSFGFYDMIKVMIEKGIS